MREKTIAVRASREHEKLVDVTTTYFQERGLRCIDFEKRVGRGSSKRPDLLLPDFNTLLEVKTFAPQKEETEEEQRIVQEMLEGKVSAYWPETFYDRFGGHLRRARQKFREYETYHTAVLFYDLHSFIHAQTPEELLRGQEYIELAYLREHPKQLVQVGSGYNKRQLRQDINTEIGAVVFHTGQNAFRVFHNRFADKNRRMDRNVFALSDDEHFEYIDDSANPRIIKLEK